MGPQEWTALPDTTCSPIRIEIHKDVVENAEVLRRMLRLGAEARRRGWADSDMTLIEDAGHMGKNLNRPGIRRAMYLVPSNIRAIPGTTG